MLEFKIRKTIHAPYDVVWKMASITGNLEQWAPVTFQNTTDDVVLDNGLRLRQAKLFMGLSGASVFEVSDMHTDSLVRRQFAFSMAQKRRSMNRITFLFDDFSVQTFLDLYEARNRDSIVFEEGKFEPEYSTGPLNDFSKSIDRLKSELDRGHKYEVRITAHVYYDLGQTMWGSMVEKLFVNTVLLGRYRKNVEDALDRLGELCEAEYAKTAGEKAGRQKTV
ncbi:MAG: hypothetical protein EA364_07735 [Balneolaceae bacterium]|nr:MAG: hypothetical protein EA364_07735 [Balneolaceae bacterium]